MPKKWLTAERTMTLPRQIEIFMAQGKSAPEAYRMRGIAAELRDGLLNDEIFHNLKEAQIVIEP